MITKPQWRPVTAITAALCIIAAAIAVVLLAARESATQQPERTTPSASVPTLVAPR